ncbi:MAG: IPT/TIG domain-containing protein [Bryobacteraceae bacterium]
MPATAVLLLAALGFGPAVWADTSGNPGGPFYSSASIVNAAANLSGPLAPNTIASIYGTGLAYGIKGIAPQDLQGGALPYVLSNTGVRVWVNNIAAGIYFVSPNQVNFLVPAAIAPGPGQVVVTLDGHAGPAVTVTIAPAAPAFFQLDVHTVIGTHADGSTITHDAPAQPGETIVLYATGLGQTMPPVSYGEIATKATPVQNPGSVVVLVDGAAVDPASVSYAGLAPGFAGLYQVNLQVPASAGADPEIRIGMAAFTSPPNLILPVQPAAPLQ